MSPRAACRLETLGFEEVYDYVGGIADWKAGGLPIEGTAVLVDRVADATRSDIPTCRPDHTIGDIRTSTVDSAWDECVVVDCENMVVGRIRGQAWDVDDETGVLEVMESGPSTVRPDQLLKPLVKRMQKGGTRLVLVTTPQGVLLGGLLREEAERLSSGEPPSQIWCECDGCPGRWGLGLRAAG